MSFYKKTTKQSNCYIIYFILIIFISFNLLAEESNFSERNNKKNKIETQPKNHILMRLNGEIPEGFYLNILGGATYINSKGLNYLVQAFNDTFGTDFGEIHLVPVLHVDITYFYKKYLFSLGLNYEYLSISSASDYYDFDEDITVQNVLFNLGVSYLVLNLHYINFWFIGANLYYVAYKLMLEAPKVDALTTYNLYQRFFMGEIYIKYMRLLNELNGVYFVLNLGFQISPSKTLYYENNDQPVSLGSGENIDLNLTGVRLFAGFCFDL